MNSTVELLLPPDYNEAMNENRECAYNVEVRVDGKLYVVHFYTVGRLDYELKVDTREGHPWFADHGAIIVEAVNIPSMRAAVEGLAAQGYFEDLIPKR
jgi:hypothetical protein